MVYFQGSIESPTNFVHICICLEKKKGTVFKKHLCQLLTNVNIDEDSTKNLQKWEWKEAGVYTETMIQSISKNPQWTTSRSTSWSFWKVPHNPLTWESFKLCG